MKKKNTVDKIINYNEVGRVLKSKSIRSNQLPEKYKKQVDELRLVVKYWLEQYTRPKQDTI